MSKVLQLLLYWRRYDRRTVRVGAQEDALAGNRDFFDKQLLWMARKCLSTRDRPPFHAFAVKIPHPTINFRNRGLDKHITANMYQVPNKYSRWKDLIMIGLRGGLTRFGTYHIVLTLRWADLAATTVTMN